MLEILMWLPICYVLMSFAEYVAHRWTMHTKQRGLEEIYEAHAILHHGRFYRTFEHDPDPVAKHHNITMNPLFNLSLGLPVWLPLYFVAPVGACVLVGFIVVHALLWSIIHREMHEPTSRWWFRNPVYRYLRDYHKSHHERPSRNFNVVCPLADWVFGTRA